MVSQPEAQEQKLFSAAKSRAESFKKRAAPKGLGWVQNMWLYFAAWGTPVALGKPEWSKIILED